MLFDAHTHLNFEKYTDEERRTLASEIEESELACLIDVASDVDSAKQALRDADDYSWCYAAVGIHPDQAPKYKAAATPEEASKMMDADIEEIRKLAAHPKAVAIGEIGL
ncbi:MAG: TatD family hydrolase, partial [Mogibacterium sp.]|nr:TatD family hydrolase [Mogibacterium sp.]